MPWTRIHQTFSVVRYHTTKNVACTVCGKRVRRAKSFSATVNPFNRNPDGTVKNSSQIWVELTEEGAVWRAQPETHVKCRRPDGA